MVEEEEEEDWTGEFGLVGSSGEDENRMMEWETGLPSAGDDLTPLSQSLIPPELASAFSISPETYRTPRDVSRASRHTITSLLHPSNGPNSLPPFVDDRTLNSAGDTTESAKVKKLDAEDANSEDPAAPALKRPRLVWTPQLHKRFVDVVTHLGIKNAVPKTIMQLMNVEGLTRENVASHLQKYRHYLKRMQGSKLPDPPSSSLSDQLFPSTTLPPQSVHEASPNSIPMPYPPSRMMPMPVFSMPHGNRHLPDMPMGHHPAAAAYHGFELHCNNMFREQQ